MICSAIQDRKLLTFAYEGALRTVEPHCHGTSLRSHQILQAYDVTPGSPPGWRVFDLSKMSSIKIGEAFQGTRPGYKANDKNFSMVHCHL